jgi:hypothetical protein
MKRIAAFILLVTASFAWSMPVQAQIFRGPDSARQAQKAANKQQKALNKQQRKAMKKYRKTQRKAAKQLRRHRS